MGGGNGVFSICQPPWQSFILELTVTLSHVIQLCGVPCSIKDVIENYNWSFWRGPSSWPSLPGLVC